ncbi:hypothetical protein M378DRAFT_83676, partial [Amanita muscaria Koide BX008]
QKRMGQYGAAAGFRRTLAFSESQVLIEIVSYLKKTLGLVDADVLTVEEARQCEGESGITKSIFDTPAFE